MADFKDSMADVYGPLHPISRHFTCLPDDFEKYLLTCKLWYRAVAGPGHTICGTAQ